MRRAALLAAFLSALPSFAAEFPMKHAAVRRLQGPPPKLDGRLDDAAWKSAPVHTGFEMPFSVDKRTPIPPEVQTSFRVLCDDETLYFGILCNETNLESMTVEAARQHDAAMWSDDDVELFFDPVGDRNEYYQLTVNAEGTKVDLYWIERGNTGKGGWSSDWTAASHRGKGFWSLELAIPFALFHNRPSTRWSENWAFSMARTRTPKPWYYSQFSPAKGYHDVANFGTLGPIAIDRSRYTLYGDAPRFALEPAEGGFSAKASFKAENRGDRPFAGTLSLDILAGKARGGAVPVEIPPRSSVEVPVPGGFVPEQGKMPVVVRLTAKEGYLAYAGRFDQWLTYEPLTIRLTEPNYRNAIYATQKIAAVKGTVTVNLPADRTAGCVARITLVSADTPSRETMPAIDGKQIAFSIPAGDLPEGRHIVRAEILRKTGGDARNPTYAVVAEKEIALRKLPPAPAVEVRVDAEGNLIVDGRPVFIRGWFGSMDYVASASAFPRAQLPHSTNLLMGAADLDAADMGIYILAGVGDLVDEAKAKLDQPIDGILKAKILNAIARTRNNPNVIGYYISDEPECRGLSPIFLKSLWEFMAEHDPYRFCKIVSRDPTEFAGSCDVICPHPYMAPQIAEDGTRVFGTYLRHIRNEIAAACAANDGSKAVWTMPGIFSYGGIRGRDPNFTEARWFVHTSLACGAKGVVPYIFNSYWNHHENRVAMDAVMEEVAFLSPAWIAPGSAVDAASSNPEVEAAAKAYSPRPGTQTHVFIVAAAQSRTPVRTTITVPALARGRRTRLVVLRENRVVPVDEKGSFTDEFPDLGAHVYTTLDVLPTLKTLGEIQHEIDEMRARPAREGNLLAAPGVEWLVGDPSAKQEWNGDLADGVRNAAGWLPVYDDRSQCVISFAKPVTFSRVAFTSPTIKSADLDIWEAGAWKTIAQWKDVVLQDFSWQGAAATAQKIRVRPTELKTGWSWTIPEITELGLYR